MIYGQGKDFDKAMKMFSQAGIESTRVYVLNPEYVQDNVQDGQAVVRACGRGSFSVDSIFIALGGDVGYHDGLRGVLETAEGGDAQMVDAKFSDAYTAMVDGNPVLNTPHGTYVLTRDRVEAQ